MNWASCLVHKVKDVAALKIVVETVNRLGDDDAQIIRAGSFRDKGLVAADYVLLSQQLVDKGPRLRNSKQVNKMIDDLQRSRWLTWHILGARSVVDDEGTPLISDVMGVFPSLGPRNSLHGVPCNILFLF